MTPETPKQHFLLTAEASTLELVNVTKMLETQAHKTFQELRWGKYEEIGCPRSQRMQNLASSSQLIRIF